MLVPLNLKVEIEREVLHLAKVTEYIKDNVNYVETTDDEDFKHTFMKTLAFYEELALDITMLLEMYFEQEKDNNEPVNFSYRLLYKKLLEKEEE